MFSLPLSRFVCSLMFAAGLVLSGFAPAQAVDYPAKPLPYMSVSLPVEERIRLPAFCAA